MPLYVKRLRDDDGEPFYIIYEHGKIREPILLTEPEMDDLNAQYLRARYADVSKGGG